MHKHSKDSCINLNKTWVNDSGLALVQVLLYNNVVHVPVSSLVSSFRRERIATVRKIYTRMRMQDLIVSFKLFNYDTTHDKHEVHG
jgi:hypothetical protein